MSVIVRFEIWLASYNVQLGNITSFPLKLYHNENGAAPDRHRDILYGITTTAVADCKRAGIR